MLRETIALIFSIAALLLSGIGIGMSIWSLAFALKWLSLEKRKDGSNSCNGSG